MVYYCLIFVTIAINTVLSCNKNDCHDVEGLTVCYDQQCHNDWIPGCGADGQALHCRFCGFDEFEECPRTPRHVRQLRVMGVMMKEAAKVAVKSSLRTIGKVGVRSIAKASVRSAGRAARRQGPKWRRRAAKWTTKRRLAHEVDKMIDQMFKFFDDRRDEES